MATFPNPSKPNSSATQSPTPSPPLLHSTLFRALDVPWTYTLIESRDTADFLPKLKAPNCIGAAVTMPHKVSFMDQVDDLTEEGRVIGAINTVFIPHDSVTGERRSYGPNTYCIGIREAFVQNFPDVVEASIGHASLVVGGGGACRRIQQSTVQVISRVEMVKAMPPWSSAVVMKLRGPSDIDHIIASPSE